MSTFSLLCVEYNENIFDCSEKNETLAPSILVLLCFAVVLSACGIWVVEEEKAEKNKMH